MALKTKYKVGELVKVRKDLEQGKRYCMAHNPRIADYVTPNMMKFAGKYVTISRFSAFDEKYHIREDGYNWTDEMFEESPEQTIVIYRKGRSVIAYDKTTKKKAEAKCNPEDTFDFDIGAQLALDRLLKVPGTHKFKIGDIVVGTEAADKNYRITNKGFIGRVIKQSFDGLEDWIYICPINDPDHEFLVKAECFRLATDKDITLSLLKKVIE